MATCTTCNICDRPGTLDGAVDVAKTPCNVREFQNSQYTLWRCSGCGSLHCAEDADLDLYYARYPLKQQKLTFHERIGYRNRLRLLKDLGVKPESKILDYGCGAGLFVNFLRSQNFSKTLGFDPFVAQYADRAALAQQYDAVVSYDVIEHSDDPRAFFGELAALVRPGGLMVIGTPNAENVSIRRAGDPSLHVPYHRHILSEGALKELGKQKGCVIAHVYGRSFYDSLYPTVNSRFMWGYIEKAGGVLDAAVEPPKPSVVARSPDLMFFALFGFFFPRGDNMILTFRTPIGR